MMIRYLANLILFMVMVPLLVYGAIKNFFWPKPEWFWSWLSFMLNVLVFGIYARWMCAWWREWKEIMRYRAMMMSIQLFSEKDFLKAHPDTALVNTTKLFGNGGLTHSNIEKLSPRQLIELIYTLGGCIGVERDAENPHKPWATSTRGYHIQTHYAMERLYVHLKTLETKEHPPFLSLTLVEK